MGLGQMVEQRYAERMRVRYDGGVDVKHLSAEDFEGLCSREYSFLSGENRLAARFYYYPSPRKDVIAVFEHGLGHGHTAYMREIETLAKRGYLVFTYDHTGCMASEGKGVEGFARSPMDLDAALRALKGEQALQGRRIVVVGHSWGGFATLTVGARHPDVTAAVAISGFRSVKAMMDQSLPLPLRFLGRRVLRLEEETNGEFARLDAVDCLRRGGVPTLVIHGDGDGVVQYKRHFLPILKAGLPNVSFRTVAGGGHCPHYSRDAEEYMNEYFRQRMRLAAEGASEEERARFVASFDFWRMTAQDPEIWEEIFRFLEAKTKD